MSEDVIHTEGVPRCPVCYSEESKVLYTGLRDRLFGAPGKWALRECLACGLVFLDPRPTPEEIGKAYKTYYTHSPSDLSKRDTLVRRLYKRVKAGYFGWRWRYRRGAKKWEMLLGLLLYLLPRRRADLDLSVMYLKAHPGGRMVDVGCGSGGLIEQLASLGWQAEGVDFDEQAVWVARERGLKVHVGTLESQGYPEASFDAVNMSHIIEHVHDPLQLLCECKRILKPGGRLVIITPNVCSLGHQYFKEAWLHLDPPRHLCIFSPRALTLIAEKAGFQKIKLSTTSRYAKRSFIASRSIQRTGQYLMDSTQPWAVHAWAGGMYLVEWAILKVKPDVGEETVVVLEKH